MIQRKYAAASLLLVFVVATLTINSNHLQDVSFPYLRPSTTIHRQLSTPAVLEVVEEQQPRTIVPFAEICPADYPPKHATLHDARPNVVKDYEKWMGKISQHMNRGDDTPLLHTREGSMKYAFWGNVKQEYMCSVWNADNPKDYIGKYGKSKGWKKPKPKDLERPVQEVLTGDWAVFGAWFYSSYGHFGHDHLPTIAFLKSVVPLSTKFLLLDHPIARKSLQEIDPTFFRRIKWIKPHQVFQIEGSITMAIRRTYDLTIGCCGSFDPLRNWLAEGHPEEPSQKTIVYYQRLPSASGGRIMDSDQEQEILRRIQAALKRHSMDQQYPLVVFNGTDPATGETLNMRQQFDIFRSAKTIIGPEGSGISGNMAFTNPNPKSCEERVQLLEFMRGREAKDAVHAGAPDPYVTHYQSIRKWPIDYHNLLYTKETTKTSTFINLKNLDSALDAMWGGANLQQKGETSVK
eukprot:CAMPEP_0194208974 /NCGR_PEP_ID=MMETSP0156-20130528/7255_1 /TAXON_ID=33649 /ORGANISM="Thalassionema nitzschioides, Strain L26-B" /LENGTH=461 /DNA_ID=CAMNT_0038936049 /DNA_START=119 /DNA_END=1504 /DNA_ORIENTATION=-